MRPSVPHLGLVALMLALAACGGGPSPRATDPAVDPAEASRPAGDACPEALPAGDDPDGYGFGTHQDALQRPSLLPPEQAWACRYDPVDTGENPDGSHFRWELAGDAQPVPEAQVADLADAMANLAPFPDGERMCTSDLGPRWLVVSSHRGDLTGIVVDDYGCREVRLTDEPFETPPGESDTAGVVPGVLDGGTDVLTALGVGDAR